MIDYICSVDVRMETSSAEVQLGQCQNHQRTENGWGGNYPCPLLIPYPFLGQEKTKKT